MSIGEKIKQRRIELGMSQRDLAEKMLYNHHSTIAKIETGDVDPSYSRILQFSEILNVPVSFLIDEDSFSKKTTTNEVGQRIRQARMEKQMTQEELGHLLGVEKSAIAKYENGRIVNLKQNTLKLISEILDIPASELITKDNIDPLSKKVNTDSRGYFVSNLRFYMAKEGKTRKDVSESIGVNYSTFSEWCNGRKYPRIEKLELLADYFGITVSELVGFTGTEKVKNEIVQNNKNEVIELLLRLHSDDDFYELVRKIYYLDNEKLDVLKQFITTFCEKK